MNANDRCIHCNEVADKQANGLAIYVMYLYIVNNGLHCFYELAYCHEPK